MSYFLDLKPYLRNISKRKDWYGRQFTAEQLADTMGLDTPVVSYYIQCWRSNQLRQQLEPHIYRRWGATRGTVWGVGAQEEDRTRVHRIFGNDVATRVRRGFQPDIERMTQINQRLAIEADIYIEQTAFTINRIVREAGEHLEDITNNHH